MSLQKKYLYTLLFILLATTAFRSAAESQPIVGVDRIVAVINEDVIMESELNHQMEFIVARLRQSKTPLPPEDKLKKQVLEKIIVERLQLQVAERTGIRIDDNTLNATIARIAQNNRMTLVDLRKMLAKEGFDFRAYREDIRRQLILNRLIQRQVGNKIKVSESEVENFLAVNVKEAEVARAAGVTPITAYRLGHILVAVPEAASPERVQKARRKAESLLKKLRNGANFRQTAVADSDGGNALEGGDLGWRRPGQIPTIFVKAVKRMGKGDISDLIRSPSGFHIIKVLDTKGGERRKHTVQQTRVRHILIKTNEITSDEDARTRLTQLKIRLEGGDSFEELAKSHSQDTGSAIKGGELGWVNPGDLVPEFEKVMNDIEPGVISNPFKTAFGWHILQVEERRSQDSTEILLKQKAREYLIQRKVEEEKEAFIRRIRDEAYVEYRLEDKL